MFQKIVSTTNSFTLGVSRLIFGAVFFAHGAQKMLGWFGGRGFSGETIFLTHQMHMGTTLASLAVIAEFLCGLGLLVGFLGRVAAFGILCKMLIGIESNLANGFFMNWAGDSRGEGYEFYLLAIALGLAVLIKGSGALSVDQLLAPTSSSKSS